MNSIRTALLLVAGLLLTAALTQQSSAGTFSQIGSSRWVNVSHIYDGDTFKTEQGEKVRLLGINTPEKARNDRPGQPFANQATKHLRELISGRLIQLTFDQEKKDRYGRLLAHLYTKDGRWINGEMVESGMAHAYTFAPNFRHCDELLQKERAARAAKRGIWHTGTFRPLNSTQVSKKHIGQFRVVSGTVSNIKRSGWSFRMNDLSVSIPRKYRKWFKNTPKLKNGDFVTVHGKIRTSSRGRFYLALHSPCDLEKSKR